MSGWVSRAAGPAWGTNRSLAGAIRGPAALPGRYHAPGAGPSALPDVPLPLRLDSPHLDVGIVVPGDGMPLAIRIRLDPQDQGVSRCEPARICIEPTRCHSVAAARKREKRPLD